MGTTVKTIGSKGYLGNWRDKAGGYGIQEPFGKMTVERLDGDINTVIGFPVDTVKAMLENFGL